MREYKTVAGPKEILVSKGNIQDAFDEFAKIINDQAKLGWTYHSMNDIVVTEKPGCFQQPVSVRYYMLIFYREA